MGFVDMLINQSDYQSALLEMDRLSYYRNIEPSATFTRRLKCYIGLNQIERGIYYYEKTIKPFQEKYPHTQMAMFLQISMSKSKKSYSLATRVSFQYETFYVLNKSNFTETLTNSIYFGL